MSLYTGKLGIVKLFKKDERLQNILKLKINMDQSLK